MGLAGLLSTARSVVRVVQLKDIVIFEHAIISTLLIWTLNQGLDTLSYCLAQTTNWDVPKKSQVGDLAADMAKQRKRKSKGT